jgi:hypothetical protein
MTIELKQEYGENPILRDILSGIAKDAAGFQYAHQEPTASNVPHGKIVIYDDGSGTKRLYFKTGKNNLGYIALT